MKLVKEWSKETEEKVRAIFGNDPEKKLNWRTWSPLEQRRD